MCLRGFAVDALPSSVSGKCSVYVDEGEKLILPYGFCVKNE